MQVVTIDKKKTPEVANWAADRQPGDSVCLFGTIKSSDDQSLVVTVEEVGDDRREAEDMESEEQAEEMAESPADVSDAARPGMLEDLGMGE